MFRPSSGVFVLGLTLLGAWGLAWGDARPSFAGRPDAFANATAALLGARNEKIRVQAALVLGRTRDERAIPFLMKALADKNATVRAMSAKALGDLRALSARDGLEVASADPNPLVRRHATIALQRLVEESTRTSIDVNAMGDRTRHAPMALRERMRQYVAAELNEFRGKPLPGSFSVDGSIRELATSQDKDKVEVKCDVQLILSTRPGKAIVMMTSGQAVVQKPRRLLRPSTLSEMQDDALKHAVRGASEELRQNIGNRLSTATTGTVQ